MSSIKRLEVLTAHVNPHIAPTGDILIKSSPHLQPVNSMASSPLTTHVLDTARGQPARSLSIELFQLFGGQWKRVAEGETNSDGRCPGLLTQDQFLPGVYKMHFDTGNYFKSAGTKGFYPFVEVVFEIEDPHQHYHVPLLLSPYSYSTYRGS